jgi:hypothetical protein
LFNFCVAALVTVSVGAYGQETAQTGQGDQNKSDRIICKEVVVTGSLLPGPRICHTKAEWDDIQRQSELDLRKLQDSTLATHGG